MKVIFTDSVTGVAVKGDSKNVKPGFYRNFLQPRKKAIPATEEALKAWDERRKKMMIEREQLRSHIEELKRRLTNNKVYVEKKVTAKGTLYGGVKAADIVKAIKEQCTIDVPETAVVMPNAIKKLGAYELKLNLGEGIETTIPVEVIEKK